MKKKILWSASALGLAFILALAGSGWYFSNQIRDGALKVDHSQRLPDLEVADINGNVITLRATPGTETDDWRTEGIWGLEWESGYGQVGKIIDLKDKTVTREYTPLVGRPDKGDKVRTDAFTFPGDPLQAFGIPFENVYYSSSLGKFPAWYIRGSGDVWAVFVHGALGATRREGLSRLPVLKSLDMPSLVITYRNDEGVPQNPDGFWRYGLTEWADLEGAVSYALEHEAKGVVLIANSMGGAITMKFLYESPLAGNVKGVILDSPMLDFGATVDYGASQRRMPVFGTPIPAPIVWIAKSLSSTRFGIDYDKLDYVSRVNELAVPVLLFQGDADKTAPVEPADTLAKTRSDIVRYVRSPGIDHVRTWNVLRSEYETALKDFLENIVK